MLWNPEWKTWKTKPSLQGFLDFARAKVAHAGHGRFDYSSPATCACAQYYKSIGIGIDAWGTVDNRGLVLNNLALQAARRDANPDMLTRWSTLVRVLEEAIVANNVANKTTLEHVDAA